MNFMHFCYLHSAYDKWTQTTWRKKLFAVSPQTCDKSRISERPRTRPSEEPKWPVRTGAKILHVFISVPDSNRDILASGKPGADLGRFRTAPKEDPETI